MAPHLASVHAELVALGVAHYISERSAIVVSRDELSAEAREPGDLIDLAIGFDVDVEVYPVLRDLALGDPLKVEPGPTPCGSRQAATSRNAERPLMVMRSSAGIWPSATSWSTKPE